MLCLLAGLAARGFSYLYRTPKLYQSRLTLEVDMQEQRIAPVDPLGTCRTSASLDQLRTIEQNLRNRSLMERVAKTDDLASQPQISCHRRKMGGAYSPERVHRRECSPTWSTP